MQIANNVYVKAVTHATRSYAATTMRQNRAASADIKAQGGWSSRDGSYCACYDRALPIKALLGAANFTANRLGPGRDSKRVATTGNADQPSTLVTHPPRCSKNLSVHTVTSLVA
jgi:hypothetical protein